MNKIFTDQIQKSTMLVNANKALLRTKGINVDILSKNPFGGQNEVAKLHALHALQLKIKGHIFRGKEVYII